MRQVKKVKLLNGASRPHAALHPAVLCAIAAYEVHLIRLWWTLITHQLAENTSLDMSEPVYPDYVK